MAPDRATAALVSLLRSTSITDHEEVLEAANAALATAPSDPFAHRTRVVALLNLDRFDDVLRALDQAGDQLRASCALERSYALYKTGKLDEARATLNGASVGTDQDESRSRGARHLAAQVAYRAEDFAEAARLYDDLLAGGEDNYEDNDLRINRLATVAQLAWGGSHGIAERPSAREMESFEVAYNAACCALARGDTKTAKVLLKRATQLCEASTELSAEEKTAELLPIRIQTAYLHIVAGEQKEAEEVHERAREGRYVQDLVPLAPLRHATDI